MGCCVGANKNININKEVSIIPEKAEKNVEYEDNKNQITDSKKLSISDKNLDQKSNNINKCSNNNKNDKTEVKKDKHTEHNISPKTNIEIDENKSKVNKNKVVKKGSQRVHNAMKKLKLLSMKEVDNNKNFFT
jgi:hypothetical protein